MHRAHMRRTVGVAALLPALLLAALYVAAPFAGTTTHAIASTHTLRTVAAVHAAPAHAAAAASTPATAGSDGGAGLAKEMGQPVHLTWAHQAIHTIGTWYGAILAMAVIVLIVAAVRFARDRDDVTAEN